VKVTNPGGDVDVMVNGDQIPVASGASIELPTDIAKSLIEQGWTTAAKAAKES
jgi:hypothetical protein